MATPRHWPTARCGSPASTGRASALDGTNDYLEIANSPTINCRATRCAFSAWVNPLAAAATRCCSPRATTARMVVAVLPVRDGAQRRGLDAPASSSARRAGSRRPSMGSALTAGPVEPPRGGLQRDAGEVLCERHRRDHARTCGEHRPARHAAAARAPMPARPVPERQPRRRPRSTTARSPRPRSRPT